MIYESAIELHYMWLPFLGFVVGLLATMIGGNGAFFFPPALILLFQVEPRVAVATSLAAVIPIGIIGSFEHYRRQNINLPVGLSFGAAGIAGAWLGAWISNLIDPATLITTFGIYCVILGLFTMRMPRKKGINGYTVPDTFSDIQREQLPYIVFFGLISGAVAGLFGTSGTAPVLAALLILKFPVKLVIGTSVMIVFINAMAGFGGHILLGEVDPLLIFWLGSGAALGAFIGPRLLVSFRPEGKEGSLRYIFSAIVVAMGILLILR